MNVQIFGTKKSFDSKKAERYFKERGIYKNVDNKIDFPISKNIDELSKQILFDRKKKDNVRRK